MIPTAMGCESLELIAYKLTTYKLFVEEALLLRGRSSEHKTNWYTVVCASRQDMRCVGAHEFFGFNAFV